MGTAYKIKCKHCGTEFQHSASACYGLYQECVGCGTDLSENVPKRPESGAERAFSEKFHYL